MTLIKLSNIHKNYSEKKILENINLEIKKGDFITIFGSNGCGKTTLLNLIAGITKQSKGKIELGGKKPKQEKIGYVFQNYRDSLLPWKTNLENIAFPLELEGINKKERILRTKELLEEFNLKIPLSNYPYQSSGGQQQLVAILREVIAKPKVILMDEPFSALHSESRSYLKQKIQEIWKKLELTIIFVSHDLTEIIQLGDKTIIMNANPGKISKTFNINFPRIRTEEIIYTKKFHSIKNKITKCTNRIYNENK